MFTSILRRRVAAFLTAGAAAAAALALAVPAGAVTGPTRTSAEMAGYAVNNAQFRQVDGIVYLRDPRQYAGMVARYGHTVQLWSADRVVSVNFTANTAGDSYTPSVTIYNRSTHQVIASNPNARYCEWRIDCWPGVGPPVKFGHLLSLSIEYVPATGHLDMRTKGVDPIDEGYTYFDIQWSYALPGQSFTVARIGTTFGRSPWDAAYTYTPPAQPVKAANYSNVRLTSYSGHTATLVSWWMNHKLIAKPSGRAQVANPGNLYNSGGSFQTFFTPKST